MEYKFQDKEYLEDIFSFGSTLEDFICVVFVPDRNIVTVSVFNMAQQVLPASQLVPKYHTIRRCNNYAMLQSILCSPDCKIVGKILLDHPLCYALTATANTITYTVDMFRDILHLLLETPDNPFVTSVDIGTIKGFMNKVGYQGMVDKVSAFYIKNQAQPWQTMFKVFNHCLTTRISRHYETKINILQIFHAVINRTNVDYTALLW
ncbi:hypothetical protein Tco_0897794 [Tanacetum coccineum]